MLKFLILPTIIFACAFNINRDYWLSKWYLVAFLACIPTGYSVARATKSKFAGALFSWVLMSSVFVTMVTPGYYRDHVVDTLIQLGFDGRYLNQTTVFRGFMQYSSEATLILVLFTTCVLSISKRLTVRFIEIGFGCAGLLSSMIVIINAISGNFWTGKSVGFFDQNSMEGVFIAVTYPLLCGVPQKIPSGWLFWVFIAESFIATILPVLACVLLCVYGKASQPLMLISGGIAFELLRRDWSVEWRGKIIKPTRTKKITLAAISVLIALAVGSNTDRTFFDASGRPQIYAMAWKFMVEMETFVWGLGTGTWTAWDYYLQNAQNLTHLQFFPYIHNDWLQVLIEQGAIGLLLLICVGAQALYRGIKNQTYGYRATALATYGAAMIFDYPMHLAVHAFLGLFLLRVCLAQEE